MKLLVVAAINCNERIEFLTQMQDLNELTQQVLMATAQEAGEEERSEEGPESRPRSSRSAHSPVEVQPPTPRTPKTPERTRPGVDSDLASEERLGRVLADNNRLSHEKRDVERQLDDAYARYERLQSSLERTQEEVKEANERLTAVLAGRGEGANRQDKQSDTIIAALEARATEAETELEELRKSNELLKVRVERTQKLQDDYDEIKIDRDRLSRKANAAEKYKQKLEASATLEKDNESLRDKVSELQTQIRQSDSRSLSTSDLQREIDEYRRLLPSIEQERYELNEMKKRLEMDYYTLEARYHDSAEELRRSQQTVEDLQGRLRDYEDGVTPAATPRIDHDVEEDLEKDEADFAEAEARLTAALVNGDSEHTGEPAISEDELRAIMSAMRAQARAGSATEKESSTRAQKKLLIAVERGRSKNKELVEHVKKQSELIHHLQDQARMPPPPLPPPKEERTPTPPPKEEPKEEDKERPFSPAGSDAGSRLEDAQRKIANLDRELRLVTSAWCEQQKRVASGGVISFRSRGAAEPKSFLGKQRSLIDVVALGGKRD